MWGSFLKGWQVREEAERKERKKTTKRRESQMHFP
jgi:hypothetical protein